jgi:hypothetical protein
MEQIRCYDCGKFIGHKDVELNNFTEKRIYDWDNTPLEDVVTHKECELAGGKKPETSESNAILPDVINCTCDESVSDKEYADCCGKCGNKIKE